MSAYISIEPGEDGGMRWSTLQLALWGLWNLMVLQRRGVEVTFEIWYVIYYFLYFLFLLAVYYRWEGLVDWWKWYDGPDGVGGWVSSLLIGVWGGIGTSMRGM